MGKSNFARLIKSTQLSLSKHRPEILTGIGIAGMFTTTILAVRATPKALRLIEEEKNEKDTDHLTPLETVKVAWKCYIPAAVSGISSAACLICANTVNTKRNATLAAAYKLSESALLEYRNKVIETVGEKKEESIRDQVNQEHIDKNPISNSEVYITKDGDTLFLDPFSKRYFRGSIDRIRKAENKLNKDMIHDMFGYVSLNDFYDEIGLDRTDVGDNIGWNVNKGLIDIHISPGLTKDDEPCIVLDFTNRPTWEYTKFS